MVETLNVIALISGGKDSFYSILHCIRNGHKVVALGNLYPPTPVVQSPPEEISGKQDGTEVDEQDLNSFMYQTVGHSVIPLYETALRIPLYRQQIRGRAIQDGTSYSYPVIPVTSSSSQIASQDEDEDETESLIPLLRRIMVKHPEANALSTGAILSTYQRTRIESVALRLGLTPLSYLWQYPILPPGTQTSLLRDMQAVGLDARIVKVASGGLDESFLWKNVASESGLGKVERSMRRFGIDGDGGVLGEGGEFETLVIDGPGSLFKGRIEIREEDRRIVREGGGAAWLRLLDAKVVKKAPDVEDEDCRIPGVLEQRFKIILNLLKNHSENVDLRYSASPKSLLPSFTNLSLADIESQDIPELTTNRNKILYWTVRGRRSTPSLTIADEISEVILRIRQLLLKSSLESSSIISTTVVLRSMSDFAVVNSIYGSLFTAPNPPSRVSISCGSSLPRDTNILIHLTLSTSPSLASQRNGLHVQSRSYWAPANIGPYSQAVSVTNLSSGNAESNTSTVSIAGQIPLIPSSMDLPPLLPNSNALENFNYQTILSLQHLFRIGTAMSVSWFTGTVAYLPSSKQHPDATLPTAQRARISAHAWAQIHTRPEFDEDDEDDRPRDLWEEKHFAGREMMGRETGPKSLPNWEVISSTQEGKALEVPSFWAAEVEELPRGAGIEWAALSGIAGGSVKVGVLHSP
ncbi:Diphthamide synthetase [Hyphodiscus hymeniophilus]|uniref:Diphthine--ammonia ligase n=1 Tax=Hyphodiscus hymeniophilus TaxID=353542 RepID=A0A9P6VP20_9HELO|nr:Diphthamide synthetase [Hyphodiscus hymeniophilus]